MHTAVGETVLGIEKYVKKPWVVGSQPRVLLKKSLQRFPDSLVGTKLAVSSPPPQKTPLTRTLQVSNIGLLGHAHRIYEGQVAMSNVNVNRDF